MLAERELVFSLSLLDRLLLDRLLLDPDSLGVVFDDELELPETRLLLRDELLLVDALPRLLLELLTPLLLLPREAGEALLVEEELLLTPLLLLPREAGVELLEEEELLLTREVPMLLLLRERSEVMVLSRLLPCEDALEALGVRLLLSLLLLVLEVLVDEDLSVSLLRLPLLVV